ncbi:MAG: M20/M25/M40 family metallo-hydrolase, partial [Saprospiraceae bacterium]|nr:M20/M25/M40 family metallo-hydrolase [Saprospiraceae bacterium]
GLDTVAFAEFNDFLVQNFPLVDSLLEHETINEFSHVFEWKGKDESLEPILLIAHLDVVPIATETAWHEPPFSGKVKEGYLWGRGSLDDKLNVVGILEAVEWMLENQYHPQRSVYLAFGHDEEIGGAKGAQAMAAKFLEEGLRFSYVLDEGMIILEEAFPGLEPPVAFIGLAEKGYTSMKLVVDVGEGGHSSMPPAMTAIGALGKAIADLEADPFEGSVDGIAGMTFDYIGPELPFLQKVVFANRWLFEGLLKRQLSKAKTTNALIRTTTAPTIIHGGVKDNVLPSTAEATINFRIKPGETIETVTERVNKVIDNPRVKVDLMDQVFSSDPSKVSPVESFGFNTLQHTIQEIFPEVVVSPTLVIAGTDSRHYEPVSDHIYRFMPVQLKTEDLSRIHGSNERIHIDQYRKLVKFYIRLLENSTR